MHWLLWAVGGIIVLYLGLRYIGGPAAMEYLGTKYDANKERINRNIRASKDLTAKEKEEGIRMLDSWSSNYTSLSDLGNTRLAI